MNVFSREHSSDAAVKGYGCVFGLAFLGERGKRLCFRVGVLAQKTGGRGGRAWPPRFFSVFRTFFLIYFCLQSRKATRYLNYF